MKWDNVRLDQMKGTITRRFVHSDEMMVAQVSFVVGDVVPARRHDNEQFTYVLTGALRFLLGDVQDEEIVVRANEILIIPSNLLHSAVADVDTFELDFFTPPRADWIVGSDTYLQR